ncbi:MAG: lysylphosphatidylglycerol synthase transmembrane domain-containing protein [Solirubrobacterales bacterium]
MIATLAALDLAAQVDRFFEAVERFAESLARIELPYLALALVLSLGLQLCRAHAWANALRAAYPGDAVSERGVIASFLVGVGANGILPARGGDALKIVLAKTSVRGSSYPAIISSFAVLVPFDSGIGLIVLLYAITQGLLPAAPRLPELPAFEISFWAAHPQLLLLTITVLAIVIVVVVAYLAVRVERFWQRLRQGVAIFSEPRRYLRQVFAWQAAGWLLRFASFWLFLEAFNIGGSADNVLLVMSVQAITGALPFTPGGAGAQQALLVVAFDGPTYAAVLAYSVGQQVAVTAWSVAIATVALGVEFKVRDWRGLLRQGREAQAQAPPG